MADAAARPAAAPMPRAARRERLEELWWQGAWVLLVAIVAADVIADVSAVAGAVGTILWFCSYVYVIAFAALAARDLIRSSMAAKAPFALFVVALYLLITVANVGSLRSFSSETAIEIGCTVHTLNAGGSFGFHQTCLFGYPMRQFLLPVLPTLAFGPSLFHMNVGGSVYFLVGTIIFAAGASRTLRSPYMGNLVAALLLSVFLQLYWWNHFFLIFEQSIFPLSLALILCGLVLYFALGDERRTLPLIGLVLLWIIGAYTPSLAVCGLGLVGLLYLAYTRPDVRFPALGVAALTVIDLWVSLGYRGDIKIGGASDANLRSDLWPGFEHLIYQNHGVPWSTPFLVFPLVVGIVLAVLGVLGRPAMAVGIWALVAIAFAIVSHGYSANGLDSRMHRALVAIPPLLALGALALRNRRIKRVRDGLEVLLLVSLLIGVKYYYDYRQSVPPTPAIPFVSWLHSHVPNEGTSAQPMTMTLFPMSVPYLPGSIDSLGYFSPHLQVTYLDPSRLGPGCPGLVGLKGIIVADPTAPCTRTLKRDATSGRMRFVGTYPAFSIPLDIFSA